MHVCAVLLQQMDGLQEPRTIKGYMEPQRQYLVWGVKPYRKDEFAITIAS